MKKSNLYEYLMLSITPMDMLNIIANLLHFIREVLSVSLHPHF